MLLFTESSAYENTTYLKRVPLTKIHLMTFFSVLQLAILIATGFYLGSWTKCGFPFIILMMVPFRHFVLPFFVNGTVDHVRDRNKKYLDVLDGHH